MAAAKHGSKGLRPTLLAASLVKQIHFQLASMNLNSWKLPPLVFSNCNCLASVLSYSGAGVGLFADYPLRYVCELALSKLN